MFLSSCVFIPPGHTGKPLGCWVSPPSGLCGLTIETPVWSIKANSILTSMFCQCSVQGRRLHLAFNGNEPTILDIAQPESKRVASTSVRNGSLRAILPFRPAFRERDNNTCEIFWGLSQNVVPNKPSVVSPTAATLYFCKPFWSVLRSQALEPSPERCWTWLGSAPKPPRPSREPSEPSPRPH